MSGDTIVTIFATIVLIFSMWYTHKILKDKNLQH